MCGGNEIHEADKREILGRNASEGIEPRNQPSLGRPTVFIGWKAICTHAVLASVCTHPGVCDHGMVSNGTVRNLGEPECSRKSNLNQP